MAARGFLGAGDLYIARFNSTTQQFDAYQGPFEATKFEIKPNVERKEQSSRGRDTYGQVIESVSLPQPADFTLEMPEVNKDTLTIALLGTEAALTQTAGTLTDEAIMAKLGAWVQLSKTNFSPAGLTVKNQSGVTTYVEGEDYEINRRLGMIKALPGGTIDEASALKVSGAYLAKNGTRIRGATSAQVRAKFLLDGKNFVDDQPVEVEVYEAIIAADSAFDFLASDFASVSLPGRLKTPVGKGEPFEVRLITA